GGLFGLVVWNDTGVPSETHVNLTHNTCVTTKGLLYVMGEPPRTPAGAAISTRFEVEDNVFQFKRRFFQCDLEASFVAKSGPLLPADADGVLKRTVAWRERRNLYSVATSLLTHSRLGGSADEESEWGRSLDSWNQLWSASESRSLEARVRFHS